MNLSLPRKDIEYIKTKINNKVRAELIIRISKWYKGINLDLIYGIIDKHLRKMKIMN